MKLLFSQEVPSLYGIWEPESCWFRMLVLRGDKAQRVEGSEEGTSKEVGALDGVLAITESVP